MPSQLPFEWIAATAHPALLLVSPHNGREYPADVLQWMNADMHTLRTLEDPQMDVLLAGARAIGAAQLLARYARCCVDLNRGADELDPKLIRMHGMMPSNTPRVRQGLGVVPRVANLGQPLYRGFLPMEEAQRRLKAYYHPFHAQLAHWAEITTATHGSAIMLDWHSCPPHLPEGYAVADIILGDAHGTACAPWLVDVVEAAFARHGLHVARNTPYAGGHITRTYGNPKVGMHALQIEVNRALYWDEVRFALNSNALTIQAIITKVIRNVASYLPNAEMGLPIAAE